MSKDKKKPKFSIIAAISLTRYPKNYWFKTIIQKSVNVDKYKEMNKKFEKKANRN